jgi:hypothetical protein
MNLGRIIGFASLFLLIGLIFGQGPANVSAAGVTMKTFHDVPSDHWSYEYVQDMINKGIIDGYADGTFHPSDSLTREQFAKLLTLTLDSNLNSVGVSTFSDINSDDWSFHYVETVKDYLEGYSLPVGKPFFDPKAVVTREDVAVALVKGMKLDVSTINAEKVIKGTVWDYDSISSGLAPYVAVAMENHLIEGYPDGTFKPRSGLDRAAAATLLSRVLKSPNMPPIKEIILTAEGPSSSETGKVQVTGTVAKDAKLYLSDEELMQSNGVFSHSINLQEEGSYDLEFRAIQPNGRYKAVIRHVDFTRPDPKLVVNLPGNTEKRNVVVSGKVTDINDSKPYVTVNDVEIPVKATGEWSKEVSLDEGNNSIKIIATNQFQKSTIIEKNVQFTVKPPELTLDAIPETTNVKSLNITGKVSDLNDTKPRVTLNGNLVSENGSISKSVVLSEGENRFEFEAVNSWGKKTAISKKVNYVILPPEIKFDSFEETSFLNNVTIKVTALDMNDTEPELYLDDRYMSTKSFSSSVTLKEGENVFTIKATNDLGKQNVIVKKINYVILPPNLNIETIPETSTVKTITVKASATDFTDRNPELYLGGVYMGEGSFTQSITLTEGVNTLTFKATNASGKSTQIEKKVTYTTPPPKLTVNLVPETTTSSTLNISASATDANDSYPKIYLNGQYVNYNSYSSTVTLREGENVFEFKATNSAGKTSEVIVKKVTYVIPGPTLTVGLVPETTSTVQIVLTASATDPNDSRPKMYLNGEYIQNTSFSKTVNLVVGENIFEFKAINSQGRASDIIVKRIIYQPVVSPAQTIEVPPPPVSSTTVQ